MTYKDDTTPAAAIQILPAPCQDFRSEFHISDCTLEFHHSIDQKGEREATTAGGSGRPQQLSQLFCPPLILRSRDLSSLGFC